jgi:D-alanyl-D-alanine carboxypeptidase/D-alanyl-D-alanine-endopeptidase (penicillin-binding protein 4)
MKTIRTLFFVASIALSAHAQKYALPPQKISSVDALQKEIKAHIDQSRFAHAQWGIKVVSLETGKTLFERNADKLIKPASNNKMYTGSLALDRLGADFRIKTSFYAQSKPDNGVVHGDLIVYGRGDPSFSQRFNNGDFSKSLQPVVDAFVASGIKRIDGNLIADESYFHCAPYGSDWAWDDIQNYYGAPVSALNLEDNAVDLVFKPGAEIGQPATIVMKPETTYFKVINHTKTVAKGKKATINIYRPIGDTTVYFWGNMPMATNVTDSVSVDKPALWFVTRLKERLAKEGIEVTGGVRSVNWLERMADPLNISNLVEVTSVQSRPLAEIVKGMMKPSQNQYAHLLLLQVGVNSPAAKEKQFTDSAGLVEMKNFMSEIGVEKNTVLIEDGSGLSRGALVTPSSAVKLLTIMAKHRCAAQFYDALPIAGVDGTLKSRFRGTFAEKNVHAKTGSLRYVNTISGYVTDRGGEKLVFSVMLNNYSPLRDSGSVSGRAESDKVVKMIADFSGRSNK